MSKGRTDDDYLLKASILPEGEYGKKESVL